MHWILISLEKSITGGRSEQKLLFTLRAISLACWFTWATSVKTQRQRGGTEGEREREGQRDRERTEGSVQVTAEHWLAKHVSPQLVAADSSLLHFRWTHQLTTGWQTKTQIHRVLFQMELSTVHEDLLWEKNTLLNSVTNYGDLAPLLFFSDLLKAFKTHFPIQPLCMSNVSTWVQ